MSYIRQRLTRPNGKVILADTTAAHASEKYQTPEGWQVYRWELLPHHGQTTCYSLSGGVCAAVFTRGPNKGRTNWKRQTPEERRSDMTLTLTVQEHREWLERNGLQDTDAYRVNNNGR